MAYQEIVAPADPAAVIDSIRSFAEANGWTVMRNTLSGANRTLTLKRAESDYIHVYNTSTTKFYVIGTIDYDVNLAPESTGRKGPRAECNVGAGPYTKLFLFANTVPAAHVHAVLESNVAGVYFHTSLGVLEKIGTYTGGTYYDSTRWEEEGSSQADGFSYFSNSALLSSSYDVYTGGARYDIVSENRVDNWGHFDYSEATGEQVVYSGIYYTNGSHYELREMVSRMDGNAFSNRSIFHRINLRAVRNGGYDSPIGSVPNIRFCNVSKFTDGQEVTIGSDVWKVFPMLRRGPGADKVRHSDFYGYAFKKTA